MARDNSTDFYSDPASWPVIATQHNDFKEIYFNGSISVPRRRQEWKAGIQSDSIFLNENISYQIPDCAEPLGPAMPDQSGDFGLRRNQLCLYRQPSGSGTSGLCSGRNPARQLDGQCGPSLGSLPTLA